MSGGELIELRPGCLVPPAPPVPPSRVRITPAARLTVEQARAFLMGLDDAVSGADLSRAMFLTGRLAEHAASLMDVLDALAPDSEYLADDGAAGAAGDERTDP